MRRSSALALMFLAAVTLSLTAVADDLSHLDATELAEEKAAREDDIRRTQIRLDRLELKARSLQAEQQRAEADLQSLDASLEEQAVILYRMSRGGKALRYLMSAESGAAFLKRANTLKRLVSTQMNARREKGLNLSALESDVSDLDTERAAAQAFLEELEETLAGLDAEIARRESAPRNF